MKSSETYDFLIDKATPRLINLAELKKAEPQ